MADGEVLVMVADTAIAMAMIMVAGAGVSMIAMFMRVRVVCERQKHNDCDHYICSEIVASVRALA
eukprot:7011191-Lingulodinium_polyedra.AAC.1